MASSHPHSSGTRIDERADSRSQESDLDQIRAFVHLESRAQIERLHPARIRALYKNLIDSLAHHRGS